MYDSIVDFITDAPTIFEAAINSFFEDEEMTLGDMIRNIKTQTDDLARRIIVEVLEQMDKSIKANGQRKTKYSVIRTDEKTLLSTVGVLKFKRCYYLDKSSGDRVHLLDRVIGITSNTKKTEDVAMKQVNQKKQVKYLFINADEDHVSLQVQKEKGDLITNETSYKSNTYMPRLVYCFDGLESTGKTGKRHRLMNRVCFKENSVAEKPIELWERVMTFIDVTYDYDYLEKIYIMGDGAAWKIKNALRKL